MLVDVGNKFVDNFFVVYILVFKLVGWYFVLNNWEWKLSLWRIVFRFDFEGEKFFCFGIFDVGIVFVVIIYG